MNPIPYGKHEITDNDIQSVIKTLKSSHLTQGPQIKEFEEAFAAYTGAKYAVAVSNGTAALHLSTMALGLSKGCNVISTSFTFVATSNCVKFCDANVYFADIDAHTLLLDIEKVERLIKSKPKGFFSGIIPVDYAGKTVNMEAYFKLAQKHGLWLIQDCCHSPGAWFTNSKGIKQFSGNGVYSNLSVFSFHPVKHIACGEGGMICTNDIQLYTKLKLLRTHGIEKDLPTSEVKNKPWYYSMQSLGFNYRLTDLQAALGLSQLKRADANLERRRQIALYYCKAFKNAIFLLEPCVFDSSHAYHLFVILVKNRLALYNYLHKKNILVQVHYIPVHFMPYYKMNNPAQQVLPVTEKVYKHCLSLPIFPNLSIEEQEYVIQSIREYFD
jgi:hypothetical protein